MKIECSLKVTCPRSWEELQPIEPQRGQAADPAQFATIRHCLECGQNVMLCEDEETLRLARQEGRCVAHEATQR
jgi:hypothetical protein